MLMNSRSMLNAAIAAATMLAVASASGQAYPTKPLRIVVPFSAGGPTDITVRTIAPRLTELLGQSIIVDNRAGATGIIGAELVAKSPPDGYTLLMATASVVAINMVTYSKLPYDTLRDLQPLTPVMTTATVLVVHPSMPVKNLKELVALAKARPGQIAMASAGNGGTLHLALEMLMKEAAVKMTHVPYKGAAPAVIDVIAGQLNGMFVDLPVISPYIKSGKVRALAMASHTALGVFSGGTDDEGSGLPQCRAAELLRPAAPREDTARHRREAPRRSGEGGQHGRRAGQARRRRIRSAHHDA